MLYAVSDQAPRLACDDCGCVVDGSERGRAAHQRWHEFHAGVDLITLEPGPCPTVTQLATDEGITA